MAVEVESEWFGDEIKAELERAAKEGLEKVGKDFVKTADPLTPVDEGELKRSTKAEKVKKERNSLSIEMGSFDVDHALHVERGTARTDGKFFYQQAADKTWPKLPDRIKDSLKNPAV